MRERDKRQGEHGNNSEESRRLEAEMGNANTEEGVTCGDEETLTSQRTRI
jgi:hypothetical protein